MSGKSKGEIIKYPVLMAYPWILCFLYCLVRGTSFWDLYLPSAYNNDDLIYYKLVEGILNGGIRGYFGYNEAHALMGGFGAWSPVILFPWLAWGRLFGWNYFSPIYANMVFLGSALCLYAGLSREKWRNIALMLVLFTLFPSLPIHILNALPETCIASFVTVFFGLTVRLESGKGGKWCLISQIVIAFLLTLMRPYMIILMIYPCYYMIRNRMKGRLIISALILAIPAFVYVLISHYFTSPYVRPLFDTGIIVLLRLGRLKDAYLTLAANTSFRLSQLGLFLRQAFEYGLTAGTQYVAAIIMALSSLVLALCKKAGEKLRVFVFYFICVLAVLSAIIFLLGYINEGGRHIWAFAIVGIVLVCDNDFDIKTGFFPAISGLILVTFLLRGALVPTDYDIPIAIEYDREANEKWEQTFIEKGIVRSDAMGYDNTVIWVMNDVNDKGETVMLNYHELYSIPAGMGINCCLSDYVTENMGQLKSGYIATPAGCSIDKACLDAGYEKVGSSDRLVLYRVN